MSKKTKQLLDYDTRHRQFLDAGKKLVKGDDVSKVTAAAIARACKVSGPLVFAHFGDRDMLRHEVRAYAKSGKVTITQPKAPVKPARKMPIKVVKAIKNKSPAKPAKKAPAKVAAKKPAKPAAKKPASKKVAPLKVSIKKTPVKPIAVPPAPTKLAPPPAPSNAE